MLKLLVVLAGIALVCYASLWFVGGATTLTWERQPSVIGPSTPLTVRVSSSYGIARIRAFVEQGKVRCQVLDLSTGLGRMTFFKRKASTENATFTVQAASCPGLAGGAAKVAVDVKSADPRGRTDSIEGAVRVSLQPAAVHTGFEPRYVPHTGVTVVKYTVAGDWIDTGVHAGQYRFRAFPLNGGDLVPGSDAQLISFFTIPWDANPDDPVVVFVRAADGRELTASVRMVIERRTFRQRDIKLTTKFLSRAVGDILGGNDGSDLIANFKRINAQVRTANAARLTELSRDTANRVLWEGAFLQLPKSSVQGQYADSRNYLFEGEPVDKQVHLGIDLASTRNTPVPAANSGKVKLAERLGIYGNCVVIDHGLGLMTLYAHLSRIDVRPGADVAKGQTVGLSGMTGLAGGDHLHFGMLVDGVEANPAKLFERNWVAKNIAPVVPAAGLEKPLKGK